MQPHICSQLGSCGWSVNDFTAFHLAPYSLRSAAGLLHRECKVLLVPSCECRTLVLNMVQDMGTVWYAVSRMPQDIVHLAFFVTFCGWKTPYQPTALQEGKWWQSVYRDLLCFLHLRITLPWVLHPISKSLSPFHHNSVPCITVHLLAVMCYLHYNAYPCAPVVCLTAPVSSSQSTVPANCPDAWPAAWTSLTLCA